MSIESKFLKDQGVRPRLSFKTTPIIKGIKIVNRKVDSVPTPEGRKNGIKYLVIHEGEEKTFFTGSISLIEKLGGVPNGAVVNITMKNLGNKNTFVVGIVSLPNQTAPEQSEEVTEEITDEDLPEEDEPADEDTQPEAPADGIPF